MAARTPMLSGKHSESFCSLDNGHGWIFFLIFVVDMARCRDVYFLFAYFNGADSYTKLQLIVVDFNDMNNIKRVLKTEESYSYEYNCYKNPQIMSVLTEKTC